jgi:hypothetical protein
VLYKARALYDCQGETNDELTFNAGDEIYVTQHGTDWLLARHAASDGVSKNVPAAYVERL